MMARRAPNTEWLIPKDYTWDDVRTEVLMDIREELRILNRLLRCPNFQGIPKTLLDIRRKIPTRKRKPK